MMTGDWRDWNVWDKPPSAGDAATVAEATAGTPLRTIAQEEWGSREWLPGKPGQSVLDVGCGWGAYHDLLAHDKSLDYTGCDISETMIALAKERYPEAQFDVADATALPYADGEFDVAFCCAVLLHLPRELERLVIEEAIRVCREAAVVQVFALDAPPRQEWTGWCGYMIRYETVVDEENIMRKIDPTVRTYLAGERDLVKRTPAGGREVWPGRELWFVFIK